MDRVSAESYFMSSDCDLIDLARQGDQIARQEITDRYQNRLYQTALTMLGSPANAEKAVKTTWQQAWEKLHEYHGESLFVTWICRALIKHVINNYLQEDVPTE
ncbi:MAG: hypothetical protein IKD10_11475 [Lentisphaeria bacterium]|nr:hypothetical protein [Lentisphaeria bacterium]MBR7145546.1 hypothetical protein [Lentisphaeria bacterium]